MAYAFVPQLNRCSVGFDRIEAGVGGVDPEKGVLLVALGDLLIANEKRYAFVFKDKSAAFLHEDAN